MSFLNNIGDVLRRVTGSGVSSPEAAFNRIPGVSDAVNRVDSVLGATRLDRSGNKVDDAQVEDAVLSEHRRGPERKAMSPEPQRRPVAAALEQLPNRSVNRPGHSDARWENPIVNAAMPVLLRVNQAKHATNLTDAATRGALALEVRLFRDRVSKSGAPLQVTTDASYLLCSYIDEVVNESARVAGALPYGGEPSLLVEFHGDAWGGEDAFANLERWMTQVPLELELLEFSELILSFGWEGRYKVMDRGAILLGDLRSRLHSLIWNERRLRALATPVAAVVPPKRRKWLSPGKVVGTGLLLAILLYGALALDLDARGRPIREAIAAWDPPIHTINLAETLPPPLPRLLSEGWVTATRVPEGWSIVFKSDRAFAVGQANFRPEFQSQIDQLGAAFAPWPGDMEVLGHSDSQPIRSKQFPDNMALSEARARVVAQVLMQTAIAGGARAPGNAVSRTITSSGRGDAEPLNPAKTVAAYERNRRVEILWKVSDLEPQRPRQVQR